MNRTRWLVLGSVLTLAGLVLGATSARAQVVGPTPGYYTPGYYYAPAPGYYSGGYAYANPAPTAYYGGYNGYTYRAPLRSGVSAPVRNSSNRSNSLQMPWLQPLRGGR